MQQRAEKLRFYALQRRLDNIQHLISSGQYAIIYQKMRDAGVTLTLEIQDELFPTFYKVVFLFTHASGSFKFSLYAFDDDEDDSNPYIRLKMITSEQIIFHLLSNKNQAAWERIAKESNLPDILHSIARFSEFLLGHFACNYPENKFLKMHPDLLDTEERDGAIYYTGHGGTMPQVFEIKFMSN